MTADQIVAAHRGGMSPRQIAEQVHVSRSYVYRCLRQEDATPQRMGKGIRRSKPEPLDPLTLERLRAKVNHWPGRTYNEEGE